MKKGKIVNDPVYGFLRFPETEIMQIIDHPWFQRLRNIRQMGTAQLVYPGASHTRLHHSLGACHLMGKALDELRAKGVEITQEEYTGARMAILLHDIGHGPYSHALEHSLADGIGHETLSQLAMHRLNFVFGGLLNTAIEIFDNTYPKRFLHQLVSSQLDVDRMDYLNRDSFYTGVSEGVIGYDRILQMLTVHDDELMVEEKGVHSVEKFIIARRLMYWQVYLHKTVLGSEVLLINILKRAKELTQEGKEIFATPSLKYFLANSLKIDDFKTDPAHLDRFCELDDNDIMASVKVWQKHEDKVLSQLCTMLVERKLYKVVMSSEALDGLVEEKRNELIRKQNIPEEYLQYYIVAGTTSNNTYNINDERIRIAMKNGMVRDISEIDNPIVNRALSLPVHKNYLCYV
jgi:HD superfamily phosphohydrolase